MRCSPRPCSTTEALGTSGGEGWGRSNATRWLRGFHPILRLPDLDCRECTQDIPIFIILVIAVFLLSIGSLDSSLQVVLVHLHKAGLRTMGMMISTTN